MPEDQKNQDQTNGAAPVLTDELMADLARNPSKIHEQPRAIRDAVYARLTGSADEEEAAEKTPEPETKNDDNPPPESQEEPSKEEKKPSEETKEEEKKPLTKEEVDHKRSELKKLSDEANRIEQKLKAAQERKKRAETKQKEWLDANPEKKPEDYLDDKHQESMLKEIRTLKEELAFLKEVVQDRDREEIESLTQSRRDTEETRIRTEIETLQADDKFAAIRTKKPFWQLNREYAGWLDNLVALSGLNGESLSEEEKADPDNALRQKALERYESDPDFKASVKVVPPEELDKLNFILEGFHRKNKIGGTLKGHLLEILDDAGVLGTVVQRGRQEAAREAANKTVAAMKNKSEEIQTLGPDDGIARPTSSDQELTPESAASHMARIRSKQDRGEKLSDEDRKWLRKIREYAGTLKAA